MWQSQMKKTLNQKLKKEETFLREKKKIDRNIYNGGHEKEIIEEKIPYIYPCWI